MFWDPPLKLTSRYTSLTLSILECVHGVCEIVLEACSAEVEVGEDQLMALQQAKCEALGQHVSTLAGTFLFQSHIHQQVVDKKSMRYL